MPAVVMTNIGNAMIPIPLDEAAKIKLNPQPAEVPKSKLPTGIHRGMKIRSRTTKKNSIIGPNGYTARVSIIPRRFFLSFTSLINKYGNATGMMKINIGNRMKESIGMVKIPFETISFHLSIEALGLFNPLECMSSPRTRALVALIVETVSKSLTTLFASNLSRKALTEVESLNPKSSTLITIRRSLSPSPDNDSSASRKSLSSEIVIPSFSSSTHRMATLFMVAGKRRATIPRSSSTPISRGIRQWRTLPA
mmetsp:Transcript_83/g.130  ORF Transcript_83/g.130 Transcript_83/m.130 type:complete len:252 (+) Transcript_83:451-1206(+)